MNKPTEKQIEAAARAIVASKSPELANGEWWSKNVQHFREMRAEFPAYAASHSLVTDAFRDAEAALTAALAVEAGTENPMTFFSENVDRWGAAEWFDRLANAIREQDKACVAKDDISFETYRMIAASSAMTLVRDHEAAVRSALTPASSVCAARKQGTAGGNDPADCDWPFCGCDPHADKVIAALQECGWSSPASSAVEGEAVALTEWERTRLSQHASANALTYMGHHSRGGLKPHEIEEMERWTALSDKLRPASPAPQTEGRK